MPRRRLYGETQKLRKKKVTRALKRSGSVTRVESTLRPAAFERSPSLEREDVEFQEIMKEMAVQRSPWSGEAPSRKQAVESVQFLAEEGEAAFFLGNMSGLDVLPLQGQPSSAQAEEPPPQHAPQRCSEQMTRPPLPRAAQTEPAEADEPPAALSPRLPSPVAASGRDATGGEPISGNPTFGTSGSGAGRANGREQPASIQFQSDPEDAALLRSLLEDAAGFQPELKFAGAAPPKARAGQSVKRPLPENPDSELDLHGKTQEEAIAMVQNYLLVSQKHKMRHVLIITGKGYNSGARGPVLKDAVYGWLERNGSRFVRDFHRAPPRHGGDGAIWIEMR